ncbi:MAG: TetR/AcrR family transcriptional regulator [Solirubrobacterales bacterium]
MADTPWGDSKTLRERRLPPGRATPREAVAENQRRRLFAALVAIVAEKGYAATTIEDLVALSGVSRKAFYEHFEDKRACFCAALEALVGDGVGLVRHNYDGDGDWEAGVHAGLAGFLTLLAAQPAAARLCFVDAYEAGSEALALVEGAFDEFAAVVGAGLERTPDREGMPGEIVRAIVGGLRQSIHARLAAGQAATLPELVEPLWSWGLSYRPPPAPLRGLGAGNGRGGAERAGASAAQIAECEADVAQRVLRGLAAVARERGYREVTIGEIAARASLSLATFYSYFPGGKEEAMLAALDTGSALMLAQTLPAYRRAHDWPHAVRAGLGACFAFGVGEPDYAHLGAVEVYAGGPAALAQRDRIMEGLRGLIEPGFKQAPEASPIAPEAIAGAVYALIHDQVRAKGPERLPEIAPLATYVVLCPFLGPEQACEVANGDGRRR